MNQPEALYQILQSSNTFKKAEATLRFKHKWLNQGFTQISNSALRDNTINPVSRLLYTLLVGRCFQKDFSYPGQETLAGELGVSERQVRRYLEGLVYHKWIEVKRRGLGKTKWTLRQTRVGVR